MILNTPVSIGEFLDKISILNIKKLNIKDDTKLEEIHKEFYYLWDILTSNRIHLNDRFDYFYQKLLDINSELWKLEDEIRRLMKENITDSSFIKTSNSIHRTNDHRYIIKNEINKEFGSSLKEIKSFL